MEMQVYNDYGKLYNKPLLKMFYGTAFVTRSIHGTRVETLRS